ncbi:MAG: hypothetical protein GY856_20390 [bacterium]|nr:hypothetical protein [bacterium]
MSSAAARRAHPLIETAALLATVATLELAPAAAAGALALVAVLWLLTRPPRQDAVVAGGGLLVASLLLGAAAVGEKVPPPGLEDWTAEVEGAYVRFCDELGTAAAVAVRSLRRAALPGESQIELFRHLQELTEDPRFAATTLILFDPDSQAVAWAGEGLLHEPNLGELPAAGLAYQRGHTAVTYLAVAPLSDDRRPWRVVVGRSLPTERLPFRLPGTTRALRWSPGAAPSVPPSDVVKIEVGGVPSIFVERPQRLDYLWPRLAHLARRVAGGLLAFTLIAVALLRGAAHRLLPESLQRSRRPPSAFLLPTTVLLTMAGVAAGTSAAGSAVPMQAVLVGASGLAAWGVLRTRRSSIRDSRGEVLGGLGLPVLVGGAWLYQRQIVVEDLAADFAGAPDVLGLRLVWCLAALGLLTLAARHHTPANDDRPAWAGTLLLFGAAAFHDLPFVALPLVAVAGAALARWLSGIDLERRPTAIPALLVIAALAGAVTWEIAYREQFRHQIETWYLPRIAPPTPAEINELHLEIDRYFDRHDLRHLLPPAGGPVDPQDLAFVFWRESPLAQRDAASALKVDSHDGTSSSFSFALSIDYESDRYGDPSRWPIPQVPAWQEAMIQGENEVLLDGRSWGVVRYWFLPRPGFRLDVTEVAELETSLVRGKRPREAIDGLPRPVLYGLYSADGRALVSPWDESPPLVTSVLGSDHGLLASPVGRCWYWLRENDDGIELLYLPYLTPRAGLERIGTHALSSLVLVAALAMLPLAVALPRSVFRGLLSRTVHSYSKRLLLVYTALLLVPLVALNFVLLRGFEERLRREQMANGRVALSAARQFLVDYLRGLEPGFGIDTQVNRELLEWISDLAHHQVNLYWGSEVYASSQQELFTAGLLPKRIPGEVFSRLVLYGYEVGSRTQHAAKIPYLELFAPLNVPGWSQQGFFLSVPLLEQEEEVSRELARMRRRAILVTTALFLLLLAVGGRLARSFTTPIMELIEGTRRIAGGAPFLDVTPREHELSALGDAIDDMARRVAEGRRKLLLEKQVVDRMVENITSGVVSLDHGRRVLLHNRVAAELLGTEVGTEIHRVLENREHLQPVAEFLRQTDQEARQATVHLRDRQGEAREWTLIWVPIPGAEDPAALLVVDDATEVLRGQRLEAWAEMARIIAHEIKNPLTPIRLSAEHMRQVYATDREGFDAVIERCTDNILKQVEELRAIASEFSIYSRIPRAELKTADLVAAMRELTAAYHGLEGVVLDLRSDRDQLHARFDAKLLTRAVRNLLENALRAGDGGRVELVVGCRDARAFIRVTDSGPGVAPDNLPRIFEPYFSTHETGTGLGLAISQRIVEEHGGRIEARNRSGGGLEMTITIPLPEPGGKQPGGSDV